MLTTDQIITIASSISLSSVATVFISYYHSKKLLKLGHEYEYKKIVIQKRIEAYDALEKAIKLFRMTHPVENSRDMIHWPFMTIENFERMNAHVYEANNLSYLLNQTTEDKFYELKNLLIELNLTDQISNIIIFQFGVRNYKKIAVLVIEIYQMIKDDYSDLYNLENIKNKKIENSFRQV